MTALQTGSQQIQIHIRDLAARCARALRRCPLKNERAQGKPDARCTRGLVCKPAQKHAHEHTGSAENIRPSLRNGFTAYSALSLVSRALLPPSPLRNLFLKNLTPAFGRRNHASSPYARPAFVFRKLRVHRISTRVRDVRNAPLIG